MPESPLVPLHSERYPPSHAQILQVLCNFPATFLRLHHVADSLEGLPSTWKQPSSRGLTTVVTLLLIYTLSA